MLKSNLHPQSIWYKLFTLGLVFCLTGCAHRHRHDKIPASWKAHQSFVEQQKAWETKGRFAAIPKSGRSGTASFKWKQKAAHYNLTVEGPFQAGPLVINGNATKVLASYQGEFYHAPSPDTLFYKLTGWNVPVDSLNYWLRGIPNPAHHYETRFENGQLSQIQQDDWQIDYIRFDEKKRPERIVMKHPIVTLKWFMKAWS